MGQFDGSFMKTTHDINEEQAGNAYLDQNTPDTPEALKEIAYLLRESQRIAGMGTYVLDIQTGIWRSSDILDIIFGIDSTYPHSVEGWLAMVHPDDRELMHDYFQNDVLSRKQPFDKIYRIIRHNDRHERWVHGWGKLQYDANGQPHKMIGIIQDMTIQKQVESALRESEKKFAKLFNDAPVWIALSDLETGAYLNVNISSLKAAGFTRQEVIGHTAVELKWITTENGARLRNEIDTHGKIAGMEMMFRTKNGSTLYGWITGEIIDINGRPALLTVTSDITDRKDQDEKSAKQMEELRRWQGVTLGRERRIGELKREVNSLALRLGIPLPYNSAVDSYPKESQ